MIKYIILTLVVCMVGFGCKVGPSVITTDADDGTRFYTHKSGKSKGGGPVVTSLVVRDKADGDIIPEAGAHFAGKSHVAQAIDGVGGILEAGASNLGAAALIAGKMKHLGDEYNSSQVTTSGSSSGSTSGSIAGAKATTYQQQGQFQKQFQDQGQYQRQCAKNIVKPHRRH